MCKGCVLVVDDDLALITLLKEALEDQGYQVCPAVDATAPQMAREMQPDVILLDYAMPRMDGAQISWQLRSDPATATIPIVLMSGHPPAARPRLPVDEELSKPLDLTDLFTTVERWTAARSGYGGEGGFCGVA
jgi:CheY-like chemotaxis protein